VHLRLLTGEQEEQFDPFQIHQRSYVISDTAVKGTYKANNYLSVLPNTAFISFVEKKDEALTTTS
jgi:hypothetical protein